jgi:hypothetical protein
MKAIKPAPSLPTPPPPHLSMTHANIPLPKFSIMFSMAACTAACVGERACVGVCASVRVRTGGGAVRAGQVRGGYTVLRPDFPLPKLSIMFSMAACGAACVGVRWGGAGGAGEDGVGVVVGVWVGGCVGGGRIVPGR